MWSVKSVTCAPPSKRSLRTAVFFAKKGLDFFVNLLYNVSTETVRL